jgi:hypothetical protein
MIKPKLSSLRSIPNNPKAINNGFCDTPLLSIGKQKIKLLK